MRKTESWEIKKLEAPKLIVDYYNSLAGCNFKGIYKYKNLNIIYTEDECDGVPKRHVSIYNALKKEIYDDELERVAKRFMDDREYYIQKGILFKGVVHIWEK